jgi:E3 ubiquitin-protein ligase BRE1
LGREFWTDEKLQKTKADSKYISAMKSKEALQIENRALKSQNSKSTEIITQLKEAEKKVKDLMV